MTEALLMMFDLRWLLSLNSRKGVKRLMVRLSYNLRRLARIFKLVTLEQNYNQRKCKAELHSEMTRLRISYGRRVLRFGTNECNIGSVFFSSGGEDGIVALCSQVSSLRQTGWN